MTISSTNAITATERIIVATEENFDEEEYLARNPDVAAAVARGECPSGYDHFRRFGKSEKRPLRTEYVEYVSQEGLSTPLPDADLISLVAGHRDIQSFDLSRRASVQVIISVLEQTGIDYTNFRSILDFGCGCGRVLAGWEEFLPSETHLFGCDINPRLVDFCQKNISHAETVRCSYYPPLPYRDGQFDLIYAASVYTHLSLPAMLQWTGEVARILRPGGVALITFHGSYYHSTLAEISKSGSSQLAEKGYYVHLHGSAQDTWQGSNLYATFVSSDFLKNLFVGFEVLRIFPGISHGPTHFASYQDTAIFRRS